MRKLTVEECLCIRTYGWGTEEEKELYETAHDRIYLLSRKLHLEYQTAKVNKELK